MTPIRMGIIPIKPRPSTVANKVTMSVKVDIIMAVSFVMPDASPR